MGEISIYLYIEAEWSLYCFFVFFDYVKFAMPFNLRLTSRCWHILQLSQDIIVRSDSFRNGCSNICIPFRVRHEVVVGDLRLAVVLPQ